MTLLPDLETNCEILWAKVQISASKSLTLGCFYRPPDSKISTSEKLVKSLDLMPIYRPDAKKFKSDHCPGR